VKTKLSDTMRNLVAEAIGKEAGRLEICTATEELLVTLDLSQASRSIRAGVLLLNGIPMAEVLRSGVAALAYLAGARGRVLQCDVGAVGTGASVELNTTMLYTGGTLILSALSVAIPAEMVLPAGTVL
jgi:hypothetical protein